MAANHPGQFLVSSSDKKKQLIVAAQQQALLTVSLFLSNSPLLAKSTHAARVDEWFEEFEAYTDQENSMSIILPDRKHKRDASTG